jgi:NitT/TauT family transport system permease protein
MWSALVAGSVVAVILVTLVGLVGRFVELRMGARP